MFAIKDTGANIYAAQTILSGTSTHEHLNGLETAWLLVDTDLPDVKAEAVMRFPSKYNTVVVDAPAVDVANYITSVMNIARAVTQDVHVRRTSYGEDAAEVVEFTNRPDYADTVLPYYNAIMYFTSHEAAVPPKPTATVDCNNMLLRLL